MSRIGKKEIPLPEKVSVDIKPNELTVKGPRGELKLPFRSFVSFETEDNVLRVKRNDEGPDGHASQGLYRSLAANMVTGVTEGFQKRLEIQGIGYRAQMQGKQLKLQLGFSHDILVAVPEGLTVKVPEPTRIEIEGNDKQQVGQFASEVRRLRPPEPYKGKGVRYEGERVRRKAGKAGAGAAK